MSYEPSLPFGSYNSK